MKFIIVFVLTAFISACSAPINKPFPSQVSVTTAPYLTLNYSGKAAGAGMMLNGSMGPMGMAIGIAIDVGIGKDIARTAERGKVSLQRILEEELTNADTLKHQPLSLQITKIEFKSASGEGDPALLEVQILMSMNGEQGTVFSSSDWPPNTLNLTQLERLKTEPAAIESAFTNFAKVFVSYLENQF